MQKLNPKTTDDRTKKEEAHQAQKSKKKQYKINSEMVGCKTLKQ